MNSEKMMEGIGYIDEELIAEARNEPSRKYFGVKKTVALIIAAVLCFSLAVTAGASAMNGPLYDILYAVFPSVAQSLKPVNVSCVDNGIRMEVVSASVEGSKAKIYISMQDIEGDRIDGTIDLYDSYNINRPFDSAGVCTKIGYDEETKTATFLITIDRMDEEEIKSGKITFSVKEFLSKRTEVEDYIDINLSEAKINPETRTGVHIRGGGGTGLKENDMYSMEYLVPQGELLEITPDVMLTAFGFVDETLRVQVYCPNVRETDSHGWLFLVDDEGNKFGSPMKVSFWDDTIAGSYEEYFFYVTPDVIENYRLFGWFMSSGLNVHGDWEVTFNLEDAE